MCYVFRAAGAGAGAGAVAAVVVGLDSRYFLLQLYGLQYVTAE